ncbi:AraC family transcriptional regulator [Cohnella luojiensis]|uniref:AraC family transcriptional regulator n=1 Tax=Cohnella luojiensis TaxID=652876 RepID=A0A4Y8M534_9BACL|nr:AraC family transcriptional regulator [Cohnella luojiensis]TFE29481.1 AraC family transcriptional regulator [Cohnella luojiensis]
MVVFSSINPFVRVAHHYSFPEERNPSEATRIGYCYAFHLVDGGKGTVRCAGQAYPVKKGDLVYFKPGVPHSFFSKPDDPLSTYNLYCELWNDLPFNTSHHLVWHESDFNRELLTPVIPCPELDELPVLHSLQHQEAMLVLFAHAVTHGQKQDSHNQLIASNLVKAFLLELAQVARTDRPIDYRILPIIDRIDREAAQDHTYQDWLAECGLGKTQFHELFKQATGLSPKAYWTQSIMKQAKAALWESNRSVTDIALDLGYSSIHHFTKQFTLYYGVSPTEFRRRKD